MATILPLSRDAATSDPLQHISRTLADDLGAVNQIIIQRMQSPVTLIPQLAAHLIGSGGKRLRPLLTLAAARASGYGGTRQHRLAACVEFIHTATLLHDDVVDDSPQRRGQPSANAVFGNQASVLVGDFLFSRAFQLMVEDGSLEVLRILSNASAIIAEGEVLQLTTANDSSSSEQTYLDVIRAKTAELFAAACRVGAVVADAPSPVIEAWRSYGLNLGIAFQIVDDVLDWRAAGDKLGKETGNDFREGKMTLPVILAIARGNSEERAFWRRTLETPELQQEGDFARAGELVARHQALADSLERARHYGAIARDALGGTPDHKLRRLLAELIDFTIAREY